MASLTLPLTQKELEKGWHWCYDWDGLLVGPPMKGEWNACTCHPKKNIGTT